MDTKKIVTDEMEKTTKIFTNFLGDLHEKRHKETNKKEWALRYQMRVATMQAMLQMCIKLGNDTTHFENVEILRLSVLDSLLSAAQKMANS